MAVRELAPTDFDDITSTFYSYFEEAEADPSFGLLLAREKPPMDEERKWFATLLEEIKAGDVIALVAEVDSHVVGNLIVRRIRPKTPADHRATLGIAVKKGFRGMGLGEEMMRQAVAKSRGKFDMIELTVMSHNANAKKLYERFGFRTFGKRPYAVKRAGRYFDEDLMYLKL